MASDIAAPWINTAMQLKFSPPDPRMVPLFLTLAVVMCGMTVVSPVLPNFAARLANDPALAATAVSAFGLARLMTNWPAGSLSEIYGRWPLLVAGPFLMAISAVISAEAPDFTVFLIARFVQGVGSAIAMTVTLAAIADTSAPENRGSAMAMAQGAGLAGWAVGPSIGGVFAAYFGYVAAFWLQAAMMLAATAIVFFYQKETRDREQAERQRSLVSFLSMVGNAGFIAACIVTFSIFFDRTALSQYLLPLAGEFSYGLDAGTIGLAMTFIAVGNGLVLVFVGPLIDRFGPVRWLLLGALITATGLVMYAVGSSAFTYLLASIIVGIGTGFTGPASGAFTANNAPKGQFGSAMGFVRMVGDFAFIIGPMIMGAIVAAPALGYRAGFVLAAVLGLIAIGSAALMVRKPRS